jgi:hypothetical protein
LIKPQEIYGCTTVHCGTMWDRFKVMQDPLDFRALPDHKEPLALLEQLELVPLVLVRLEPLV